MPPCSKRCLGGPPTLQLIESACLGTGEGMYHFTFVFLFSFLFFSSSFPVYVKFYFYPSRPLLPYTPFFCLFNFPFLYFITQSVRLQSTYVHAPFHEVHLPPRFSLTRPDFHVVAGSQSSRRRGCPAKKKPWTDHGALTTLRTN